MSEEEKKLKNYIDTTTLEQVIEKLKDNDGMTWYFDYQAQYQPCYKKVYRKEIDLILEEIERLKKCKNEVLEYLDISNMSFIDKNEIAVRLKGSDKE